MQHGGYDRHLRKLRYALEEQQSAMLTAIARYFPTLDPARLQGLVTASAAEQGLAIERLDTEGLGVVQVSLQPVAFAQLLRWIQALEGQGVRVEEAGLDRAEENRVTARLNLRVDG